jgi:hypothetical protein
MTLDIEGAKKEQITLTIFWLENVATFYINITRQFLQVTQAIFYLIALASFPMV